MWTICNGNISTHIWPPRDHIQSNDISRALVSFDKSGDWCSLFHKMCIFDNNSAKVRHYTNQHTKYSLKNNKIRNKRTIKYINLPNVLFLNYISTTISILCLSLFFTNTLNAFHTKILKFFFHFATKKHIYCTEDTAQHRTNLSAYDIIYMCIICKLEQFSLFKIFMVY